MSTINTNGIDTNYPVPGVNNTTQGFRNNFTAIKNNLNIAANELTDLENKVVLKAALANSVVNNDMANTLISNASTRSFRATTYNLGNALSGTVVIDASIADVQYGNVAGDIILQFNSWAPTDTQQSITLQLGISNNLATISFPSNVQISSNNYGVNLVENFEITSNVGVITAPHDVSQLNLEIMTVDCGNSLYIEPINRPFQSTQIQKRTPPSTGQQGDKVGTVCVDTGATQLVVTGANTDPYFTTSDTALLYTGLPVTFTGVSLEANVVVGNTYYIRNVVSNTTFTVSSTVGGANIAVASNATGNTMLLNPVQYMYIAVDDFSANYNTNPVNIDSTTSPNLVICNSFTNIANNNPIMFTGDSANLANVGLESNTVYYIKNAWSGNNTITISKTRFNGIAGPEYQGISTVASNVGVDFVAYDGLDIFRRIPLEPF